MNNKLMTLKKGTSFPFHLFYKNKKYCFFKYMLRIVQFVTKQSQNLIVQNLKLLKQISVTNMTV